MRRSHIEYGHEMKTSSRAGTADRPGIIYYDMTTKNNSTTDFIPDVFLNTSQNQNIISKPKDYDVAVIRFSIPSESVPLIKQFFVISMGGSFTNGSNIVTRVTADLKSSPISNLSVGMMINIQPQIFSSGPVTTITSIKFTSPTEATLTLSLPYDGFTGVAGFSASLFVVTAYDTTSTASYSVPVLLSPFSSSYEDIITNVNYTIAEAFYAATLGTLPSPFLRINESNNLISVYGHVSLNTEQGITSGSGPLPPYFLLFSDQFYQLFKGLPQVNASDLALPLAKHKISMYENPLNSGLNVVTITPRSFTFNLVANGTLSVTSSLVTDTAPHLIYVGSTVTGPVGAGIPPGTTVDSVAIIPGFTQLIVLSAIVTGVGEFNLTITPPAYDAFQMTQAFSSLYNWTPLKRIILTTSLIPVKSTITQPPLSLAVASTGSEISTPSQSVFRPIMTDFEPIVQRQDYTPYQYYPQGPWRLIPMQGEEELRSSDMQKYWEDFNGNLNLFRIPPTKESSVLIAYVPK